MQAQHNENGDDLDHDRVQRLEKELAGLGRLDFTITPLEFEKDDDNNLHMDFIVAVSVHFLLIVYSFLIVILIIF